MQTASEPVFVQNEHRVPFAETLELNGLQDLTSRNFMFCWPCILVQLYVNDQLDAQLRYIIRLLS